MELFEKNEPIKIKIYLTKGRSRTRHANFVDEQKKTRVSLVSFFIILNYYAAPPKI